MFFTKKMLEKLDQKLYVVNEGDDKKKGKPAGRTFEEKQTSYLEMLNGKKIKEPKSQTMEYYQIQYDKDKDLYYIM